MASPLIMAAASIDSSVMRGARHARCDSGVLAACVAGAACVLIAGGCAALSMRAGFGQHASAFWISALALATMVVVPLLMARQSSRYTTLKTAATLIVTMCAISAVPTYLNGFQHGNVVAALLIVTGGMMLFHWQRSSRSAVNAHRHVDAPVATIRHHGSTATPALLALLAGLSSGCLARFQLFTFCGASGAQPLWQFALLFATVCALACVADRSNRSINGMLMALYVTRAALIGVLASFDNPTFAPFASKVFLLLDCLTIPALANLRGNSNSPLSATCPGVTHHIGMVTGAALATSPYFFGDGFVVLFALSATANLLCAASLVTRWLSGKAPRLHANRYHQEARASR
jgi:hypothetical protein